MYGVEAQSACNPTALIQSLFIMDCAQCDLLGIYRFSQEDCAFLHKSMDQYGAQQGLMISYGSLKHFQRNTPTAGHVYRHAEHYTCNLGFEIS